MQKKTKAEGREEEPLMELGILLCATGNEAASCLSLLGDLC